MSIGRNIEKLRNGKGMTQATLADLLSVSEQTVSQWEGDQAVPEMDVFLRLKEIFGVSVDQILEGENEQKPAINPDSLDTICAALAYAAGVEVPACAAEKNRELSAYIDEAFGGERADRIVMYNPDAIAQWIYEKYSDYLKNATNFDAKKVYLAAVMPSPRFTAFRSMKSP